MTDAVVAAADSLRYTENAATVILVSDGIETCNPDPCAAAQILAETGVDFTAHVIGFDVCVLCGNLTEDFQPQSIGNLVNVCLVNTRHTLPSGFARFLKGKTNRSH